MSYRDPVFRGCTRPPMIFGVPMVPIVILTLFALLAAMLSLYVSAYLCIVVIAAWVPTYAWMRMITKADDQRLGQLILRLRMRARMGPARRFWGAVTYLPLKLKKRR